MMLPEGFDATADDAVEQLVASGFYEQDAAEAVVRLLRSDDHEHVIL